MSSLTQAQPGVGGCGGLSGGGGPFISSVLDQLGARRSPGRATMHRWSMTGSHLPVNWTTQSPWNRPLPACRLAPSVL